MDLLYYWQPDSYARDAQSGFGYHLKQNSSPMTTVTPGNRVWVFTRRKRDKICVLAAELVVAGYTHNPPSYRYGKYRIWGNMQHSRYVDITNAPNAELLIRSLSITTQVSLRAQAFQGHSAVRQLSADDRQFLQRVSHNLPTHPRGALYPEDEIEARLVLCDDVDLIPPPPSTTRSQRDGITIATPHCSNTVRDSWRSRYSGSTMGAVKSVASTRSTVTPIMCATRIILSVCAVGER